MVTGVAGLSDRSRSTAEMASTTSRPEVDLAEDGVLAVEPGAASAVTMKNCEPFVFGPAFAIASAPRTTGGR